MVRTTSLRSASKGKPGRQHRASTTTITKKKTEAVPDVATHVTQRDVVTLKGDKTKSNSKNTSFSNWNGRDPFEGLLDDDFSPAPEYGRLRTQPGRTCKRSIISGNMQSNQNATSATKKPQKKSIIYGGDTKKNQSKSETKSKKAVTPKNKRNTKLPAESDASPRNTAKTNSRPRTTSSKKQPKKNSTAQPNSAVKMNVPMAMVVVSSVRPQRTRRPIIRYPY
uniref:Uncharacterized protein n=1 Tax=Panagrolaimus sp. ES5 TaxID=591445 RepID=A0AC34FKZ2_9BILA